MKLKKTALSEVDVGGTSTHSERATMPAGTIFSSSAGKKVDCMEAEGAPFEAYCLFSTSKYFPIKTFCVANSPRQCTPTPQMFFRL